VWNPTTVTTLTNYDLELIQKKCSPMPLPPYIAAQHFGLLSKQNCYSERLHLCGRFIFQNVSHACKVVVEAYCRIGASTYALLIPLAALTLPNSIFFRNDENFKFFFSNNKKLMKENYWIFKSILFVEVRISKLIN